MPSESKIQHCDCCKASTDSSKETSDFRVTYPSWSTVDFIAASLEVATYTKTWGQRAYVKAFRAFRQRFPGLRSRIEALPDDVLFELFKAFGWREVLCMRQVCTRLQEISRAKTVWLSQLERISLALPVAPRLEGHRDLYTSQQVEDFFLSRITADIGWLSGKQPRSIDIPLLPELNPEFQEPISALVEGGRWLLVLDQGRVYAQDLDAPHRREPEVIIDTEIKAPEFLFVEVDRTQPNLTFNLSILPSCSRTGPDSDSTLHIYRVHLTGHGKDARLVAEPSNRVFLTAGGRTMSQDFSGKYFARVFAPFDRKHRSLSLEVYDWNLSNQSIKNMASKEIRLFPVVLAILPGSRIIGFWLDSIIIFNIVQVIPTAGDLLHPTATIETFWEYHLDGYDSDYRSLSRPLCGPNSTRITASDATRVFGINIPHSGATPSIHVLYNNIPHLAWPRLGINKVYFPGYYKSYTINIAWPDEDRIPSSPLPHQPFYIQSWPFKLRSSSLFDEGSGRIVFFTDDGVYKIFHFDFYRREVPEFAVNS